MKASELTGNAIVDLLNNISGPPTEYRDRVIDALAPFRASYNIEIGPAGRGFRIPWVVINGKHVTGHRMRYARQTVELLIEIMREVDQEEEIHKLQIKSEKVKFCDLFKPSE